MGKRHFVPRRDPLFVNMIVLSASWHIMGLSFHVHFGEFGTVRVFRQSPRSLSLSDGRGGGLEGAGIILVPTEDRSTGISQEDLSPFSVHPEKEKGLFLTL